MHSLLHVLLESSPQSRVHFHHIVHCNAKHVDRMSLVNGLHFYLDAVLEWVGSFVSREENVLPVGHQFDFEEIADGLVLVVNGEGARVRDLGVILVVDSG